MSFTFGTFGSWNEPNHVNDPDLNDVTDVNDPNLNVPNDTNDPNESRFCYTVRSD